MCSGESVSYPEGRIALLIFSWLRQHYEKYILRQHLSAYRAKRVHSGLTRQGLKPKVRGQKPMDIVTHPAPKAPGNDKSSTLQTSKLMGLIS